MSDISDMMYEHGFNDGYQKALSELKLEPPKDLLDMSDEAKVKTIIPKLKGLKKYIPDEKEQMILTDAMFLIKMWFERIPKKGAWIFTGQKNAYGGIVIECPFCEDKYAVATPLSEHFCRNCGAKLMD